MFAIKGMKDATTSRPASSAILAIDSEDRFDDYTVARNSLTTTSYNASPYDFQITKNESMMNGFFTRLALTEVNFPWVIPNINTTTRRMVVLFQVGANPPQVGLITLPIGFYKPSDIAAAVQTQVRALDPTLVAATVTYGSTGSPPATLPIFLYATNAPGTVIGFSPLIANSTAYPYPPTTKQLFNLMGFTTLNTAPTTGSAGISTFCQTTRYIDIVCSQLTYNQALKDTMSQPITRDTLCRLYLGDGPYTGTSTVDPSNPAFCPPGCAPFTIYRQFTNPKFIRWMADQPVQGNLRFEVFDDNGVNLALLVLPSPTSLGENWSMTLLVSED